MVTVLTELLKNCVKALSYYINYHELSFIELWLNLFLNSLNTAV